MDNDKQLVKTVAERHGVSTEGVTAALDALKRGNGTMAQFSHADFGGMAQWSKGGMSMVGDMFNSAMKAKLDGVMNELSTALADAPSAPSDEKGRHESTSSSRHSPEIKKSGTWPEEFGSPSSSGSQNDMRYAFFPEAKRLIVEDAGKRTTYDTGHHRITGVSQQQSGSRSLRFQSQDGDVRVDELTVVD